ncbi:mitochondrial carrier domain-containing protein [Blakeslea trispora]|nr:mitochondrial carrier domain-containing protein [Blakeslea trispora]
MSAFGATVASTTTWSAHQLFGLLDHNKDGAIDAQDLVAVCSLPNAAIPLNKSILLDIQTECESNNHKSIEFTEFASLLDQHAIGNDISSEHLGKIMTLVARHTLSSRVIPTVKSDTDSVPWISLLMSDTTKYLIAGAVAGAVSRTVVSPMERMKILFQVQTPGKNAAYSGVWSTLNRMWQEEGWRGFMRGNGTNVIRMVPYSASQFAAYEQCKSLLMQEGKTELDTPRRLIAGAVAGTVSVVCTYPLDLVRTRLSIQSAELLLRKSTGDTTLLTKKSSGILSTTKLIYQTEGGLRGLYRGLGPTTLGVAPYVALNFQCYEVLKDYLIPIEESQGNIRKLLCGALAGSIAQTIIYPLDVLRRRFQVSGMNNMDYKYNGTWHALKTMAKKEGIKSLYRGLLPNYLKVAPAMGVTFYSYELCKEVLHAK